MTIFLCEPGYTGILSGIYDAGVSKIPQDELRLEIKNSGQNVELFAVYRECSPSEEKGKKVLETVRQRLNSHIQEQLYVASLSEDVLRADKMYRYLKVLFLRGASAADQLRSLQSMRYLSCVAVCIMKNISLLNFCGFRRWREAFLPERYSRKMMC